MSKLSLFGCWCGMILMPVPPKHQLFWCAGCMRYYTDEAVEYCLRQAEERRYQVFPGDFAPGGRFHFIEGNKPPSGTSPKMVSRIKSMRKAEEYRQKLIEEGKMIDYA